MAKQKSSGFSLKDQLFNPDKVRYLAELFHAQDACFDVDAFVRAATRPFPRLELKQRITHLSETFDDYLDPDFRIAAKQLQAALPPKLNPKLTDDDFGDFIFAPLGEFVFRNGMDRKHLKLSLRTLKSITQRFSMEDAIRKFINAYPDETMATLETWSTDSNYHVRRLVSEGTRPTLPWSGRLKIEIERPLPMLDQLHSDPTRYVIRSVANHLNDIAKINPELVLKHLRQWKKLRQQNDEELNWLNRHALRTLIKQGHPQTLKFLGFRANPEITVTDFSLASEKVEAGEAIQFSFTVIANRDEPLIVDYVIDFVKANGTHAPKVHKLKQLTIAKNETVELTKSHRFRANATTYKLYPGIHRITLQINGKPFGTKEFQMIV